MKVDLIVLSLALSLGAIAQAATENSQYNCKDPYWNSPAESHEGLFTGDLSLECSITASKNGKFEILELRKSVIDKIHSESTVHRGPEIMPSNLNSVLDWEVSHDLKEEGDSVKIREIIEVSTPSQTRLNYKTRSLEISATGMARYLKSVEFLTDIESKSGEFQILFRNRVQVERPWYALDLIFAPIARSTCISKLNHAKDRLMPWLVRSLNLHP